MLFRSQPFSLSLRLPPLGMLVFKTLDAPKLKEIGKEKRLMRIFKMPAGIPVPQPKKRRKKPVDVKTATGDEKKLGKSKKGSSKPSSSTNRGD